MIGHLDVVCPVKREEKRAVLLEILAVLAMLYLATIFYSAFTLFGTPQSGSASADRWYPIRDGLERIPLLLFVMWRAPGSLKRFGLGKPRVWDLLSGLAGWIWIYFFRLASNRAVREAFPQAAAWSEALFRSQAPFQVPHGMALWMLFLVSQVFNALTEELGNRAYFLTRFADLTANDLTAVLLSSLIFASYHTYQGIFAIPVFLSGIFFALLRMSTKSVWPCVVAHAVLDIMITVLAVTK